MASWRGARKVSVAFAVAEVPAAWLDALAPGGRLVAPVGTPQTLTLYAKDDAGRVDARALTPVRYVVDWSSAASTALRAP